MKLLDVSKASGGSKLDPRVQNLVSLLFDIEAIKHTLIELDIDMKKMPLGMINLKKACSLSYYIFFSCPLFSVRNMCLKI